MANPEHLAKLKEGVEAWNQWRKQNPDVEPDLSKVSIPYKTYLSRANLCGTDLSFAELPAANLANADLCGAKLNWARLREASLFFANLSEADLCGAYLDGAHLGWANLRGANLAGASFGHANLEKANLIGANLREAKLIWTDLRGANLGEADLSRANLSGATLVRTNLEEANLTACYVFGISVWNVRLEGAIQSNLVITPGGESPIQVDNLEVAQFIYLLLNNEKIRNVIDTITSKVVLILGRFTTGAKSRSRRDSRRAPQARLFAGLVRFREACQQGPHRDDLHAGQHGPVRHRRSDRPEQCAA